MARMMRSTEEQDRAKKASIELVAERFGCGASTSDERRACALYLWLLGPNEHQISCPCH